MVTEVILGISLYEFRAFSFSKLAQRILTVEKIVTHRRFISKHAELFGHLCSVSIGGAGPVTEIFGIFYPEIDFCVLLRQKQILSVNSYHLSKISELT